MKKIECIYHVGKMEDIYIHSTSQENIVKKVYLDKSGEIKKTKFIDVTNEKLINRRARNIQDYLYNMIENFNYSVGSYI